MEHAVRAEERLLPGRSADETGALQQGHRLNEELADAEHPS